MGDGTKKKGDPVLQVLYPGISIQTSNNDAARENPKKKMSLGQEKALRLIRRAAHETKVGNIQDEGLASEEKRKSERKRKRKGEEQRQDEAGKKKHCMYAQYIYEG